MFELMLIYTHSFVQQLPENIVTANNFRKSPRIFNPLVLSHFNYYNSALLHGVLALPILYVLCFCKKKMVAFI